MGGGIFALRAKIVSKVLKTWNFAYSARGWGWLRYWPKERFPKQVLLAKANEKRAIKLGNLDLVGSITLGISGEMMKAIKIVKCSGLISSCFPATLTEKRAMKRAKERLT